MQLSITRPAERLQLGLRKIRRLIEGGRGQHQTAGTINSRTAICADAASQECSPGQGRKNEPACLSRADTDINSIWNYVAQDDTAAVGPREQKTGSDREVAKNPNSGHFRDDTRLAVQILASFSYLSIYRIEGRHINCCRVIPRGT